MCLKYFVHLLVKQREVYNIVVIRRCGSGWLLNVYIYLYVHRQSAVQDGSALSRVKVNFDLQQATKSQRGIRGIAVLFL
jgi:hypothetical protein